ncbi:MAG: DUF4446 family protein [Clostridia bacterium]|nr:DUF4446 family protein [Clostridia bacterium]
MESKILAGFNFDPGILIIAMFVLIILLLAYTYSLQRKQSQLDKKYRAFMRGGRGAKSLDEALENKLSSLDSITDISESLNSRITRLENSLNRSYQKIGIVKYDAFKEMGGKLSFAYALLNDSDDGFIINSIYSKEGCYNYIKEIIKGESFLALGDEEAEALEMAKQYGMGTE